MTCEKGEKGEKGEKKKSDAAKEANKYWMKRPLIVKESRRDGEEEQEQDGRKGEVGYERKTRCLGVSRSQHDLTGGYFWQRWA